MKLLKYIFRHLRSTNVFIGELCSTIDIMKLKKIVNEKLATSG